MKQDTDCLIETLRLKKSEALFYKTAADRLEELQRANQELKTELNYALAELHQARGNARPEPSRLEIAAMCLQGMVSSGSWGQSAAVVALEYTDKLIASAKEVK